MLPIRDHNPSGRTLYVTYTLIVIIIIGFNLSLWEGRALNVFFYNWGMVPAHISEVRDFYSLITSQFLHGGLMHIGDNMLFLCIFGDNMEGEMSHVGFLVFYLASGVAAALTQWVVEPSSTVVTIKDSGASQLSWADYLLFFPKAKVDILLIFIIFFKIASILSWITFVLWFALQVGNGVISDPDLGGVAYWAHADGFLVGLIFTFSLFVHLGATIFWKTNHSQPPHPACVSQINSTS